MSLLQRCLPASFEGKSCRCRSQAQLLCRLFRVHCFGFCEGGDKVMKSNLLVVVRLACAVQMEAQGTLQFKVTLSGANEVPSLPRFLSSCEVFFASVKLPFSIMAAIGRFQKGEEVFHAKMVDGELFRLNGELFGSPTFDKRPAPAKGVRTLAPVVPSKIVAVGLNYADHARDTGKPLPQEPLFWFKAPSSLLPDGAKIEVPYPHHRVDYEAELVIVIGRRVRNITPAASPRYILGYTTAQDISDRTVQSSESQWCRAKSFDTFTPLGPYIETKIDPND